MPILAIFRPISNQFGNLKNLKKKKIPTREIPFPGRLLEYPQDVEPDLVPLGLYTLFIIVS